MFELKKIEAEWKARMHKALSFDGVNDYVDCGNDKSLDLSDELTILVWINFKYAEQADIYCHTVAKTYAYSFGIKHRYSNRSFFIVYSDTSLETHLAELNIGDGQWHMTGVVFAYPKAWFVRDGILTSAVNYSIKPCINTNSLKIGTWSSTYGFNKAKISSVRIYNRGLSESEIKYLYHNPFDPIDPEHLVLWLNPAGIDVANGKWWDLSGKGNHGTIHGATEVKLIEEEVVIQ